MHVYWGHDKARMPWLLNQPMSHKRTLARYSSFTQTKTWIIIGLVHVWTTYFITYSNSLYIENVFDLSKLERKLVKMHRQNRTAIQKCFLIKTMIILIMVLSYLFCWQQQRFRHSLTQFRDITFYCVTTNTTTSTSMFEAKQETRTSHCTVWIKRTILE